MGKKGTWKLSQQYRKSIWPLQMYQHWSLPPRWHHEHQIIEKWVGTLPPHPKFCLPFELNWLNSLFCLWVPVYQLLLTSVFLLSRVYEMEENKHSELYSLFFFFLFVLTLSFPGSKFGLVFSLKPTLGESWYLLQNRFETLTCYHKIRFPMLLWENNEWYNSLLL